VRVRWPARSLRSGPAAAAARAAARALLLLCDIDARAAAAAAAARRRRRRRRGRGGGGGGRRRCGHRAALSRKDRPHLLGADAEATGWPAADQSEASMRHHRRAVVIRLLMIRSESTTAAGRAAAVQGVPNTLFMHRLDWSAGSCPQLLVGIGGSSAQTQEVRSTLSPSARDMYVDHCHPVRPYKARRWSGQSQPYYPRKVFHLHPCRYLGVL
jgi:hypothetical protein